MHKCRLRPFAVDLRQARARVSGYNFGRLRAHQARRWWERLTLSARRTRGALVRGMWSALSRSRSQKRRATGL